MPDFRGVVTDMFRRPQHELGLWLQHVHEVWRRGAVDMCFASSPFQRIQPGILRGQTLAYIRRLDHDSKSHSGEAVSVAHEDSRMRASGSSFAFVRRRTLAANM